MPRKRKPAENYYQLTGRPHSGLQNPERYGMTFDEVVALIDNGKWVNFKTNWDRNYGLQYKIASRLNYICPRCGKEKKNLNDWMKSVSACKACSIQGRITVASLPTLTLSVCSVCTQIGQPKMKVGASIICVACYKELLERCKNNSKKSS